MSDKPDFENDEGNKAQRLFKILEATKAEARNKKKPNQYNTINQVWASVFDIDPTDTLLIYKKIGLLSNSLEWAEQQIEASDIKRKESHTRNLPRIHKALNQNNIAASWQTIEAQLTEQTLTDLQHTADRLAELLPENEITSEYLNELMGEIEALSQLLAESELDPDLREVLLDLLETARQMMSDYRIRGSDAIKEIIIRSVGQLNLKRELCEKEIKNPDFAKFIKMLKTMDTVYSKVTQYGPLLKAGGQCLIGYL